VSQSPPPLPFPLVPIEPGLHRFGPDNATLLVKTGRRGAAAMAGHDLVIEVTSWEASLDVGPAGEPTSLEVDVDPRSLRVREGTGGVQPLNDEDRQEIARTIDDEVLEEATIRYRSTDAEASADDRGLLIGGTLELAGQRRPLTLEIGVGPDGEVTGGTVVRQSEWGIKPYSGLFGALKVADEVEISVDANPPTG